MKPILALRHVAHEGLGALEERFRRAGVVYNYVDLFDEAPRKLNVDQLAGLVILGGPMNVDETDRYPYLAAELDWIRHAIAAELPTLGICLGAQLLAKALGAKVFANHVKEIGWGPITLTPEAGADPLLAGCPGDPVVFHWHGDTFDVPDGAVHLAASANCRSQAFRFGPSAYGLQFHLEVTAEMIDAWIDANEGELAELDYVDPAQIRRETPVHMAGLHELAERVFTPWAAMCRERMRST